VRDDSATWPSWDPRWDQTSARVPVNIAKPFNWKRGERP
jgi:hypothetical protein